MRRLTFVLLILLTTVAQGADLRLVTWNVLNFPGSTGEARAPHFRTVLADLSPDLIVLQEINSEAGADQFLSNILEVWESGQWLAAPFHNSYDSDRALFYRAGTLEVLSSGWIDTALRDIEWWHLSLGDSRSEFRLYTLHLKAGQGSTNENRRYGEALALRTELDALPPDLPFIVAGDFNIYHDTESAYQLLMSVGAGQLHDPIEQLGHWHDNIAFAPVHTQSTRTTSFGGGATGGMDDRFDQILVSEDLLDDSGLDLLPDTYEAFGNDGNHFNVSIIYGGNDAVSPEVANALHESSDHLPVLAVLREESVDAPEAPQPHAGLSAWPNPFNPQTRLGFSLEERAWVRIGFFDVQGRRVASLSAGYLPSGFHHLDWRAEDLPSGLYLACLELNGDTASTARLLLLR